MKKFLFLLIGVSAIFIVLLGAAFAYGTQQLQPRDVTQTERTSFIIPKGQSITRISERLEEEGFIRNGLVFRTYVKLKAASSDIQAGSFLISPSMSVDDIIAAFGRGVEDVRVTVLEGWRVEEIADAFSRDELPEYDSAEFLELAKEKEGYLFPDTYLLTKNSDAQVVYDLLTQTFEQKVTKGLETEISQSKRSLKDAIIMASIVQREAKGPEDMRQVAGILWNRVDVGMALNADATLQYIKGYSKTLQTWWQEPLAADKDRPSPFNTYLNPGLPPAPISNPGLDAIRAALNPVETDNMYYLHDNDGVIHYAKTLQEHNANVAKWLR